MFDTHTHLADKRYDKDREDVIKRARDKEINYILDCGWDVSSSKKVVENSKKYGIVFGAVGIHPHDAEEAKKDYLDILRELGENKKIVAIGEIGLDFYRNLSPPDIQIRVFKEQLMLAKKLSLPGIIHSRKAVKRTIEVVKEVGYFNGVFHALSASYEDVKEIIEMGFYVSVNGSLTYNSKNTKEWLKRIPRDKILVETDSPYLTPYPFRGKRNEPSYLLYVIDELSNVLEIQKSEAEKITEENGKRLFSIH